MYKPLGNASAQTLFTSACFREMISFFLFFFFCKGVFPLMRHAGAPGYVLISLEAACMFAAILPQGD